MREMFEIVSENNPVQLKMSSEELDLAVRLTRFLNEHFDETDFYATTSTHQAKVEGLLTFLQGIEKDHKNDTEINFSISKEQYSVLRDVFVCADSFFEDDFEDEFTDDEETIERIVDVMVPT